MAEMSFQRVDIGVEVSELCREDLMAYRKLRRGSQGAAQSSSC
jgi:hypothetical protein